jgi:hypothetical protein
MTRVAGRETVDETHAVSSSGASDQTADHQPRPKVTIGQHAPRAAVIGLMVGPTTILATPTMRPTTAVSVMRTPAQSRLRNAGHPIAQTSAQ